MTKYKVPDNHKAVPFFEVLMGESFRFANDLDTYCIKVGHVIYEVAGGRQYNVNAVNRKCVVRVWV